jgi:hypothetical protein
LTGDPRDQIEVVVVVEDRQAADLGDGGDHEVRDRHRTVLAASKKRLLHGPSARFGRGRGDYTLQRREHILLDP